jgi:hypothetical protein
MADEQDRPDEPRETTPPAAEPPASNSPPPAKHAAAKAAKKAVKKAVKKAPAKAAKATKATPKKAAKKAPPPPAEPAPPPAPEAEPPIAATLADTNGETRFGAANETAAHARQAVDTAGDSLASSITRVPGTGARLPIAVALVLALVAILLIRRLLSDD